MLTLLSLTCFAAPPAEYRTDSGAIEASIVLPADPDVIRAFLANPTDLVNTTRVGTVLQTTTSEGCTLDTLWISQGADSAMYTARTCPTERGMHTSLVESRDLTRFEADWTVVPVAGGTRLTYTLDLATSVTRDDVATGVFERQSVVDSLYYIERNFRPPLHMPEAIGVVGEPIASANN